jgi:vancomycin resistance protein YoaR
VAVGARTSAVRARRGRARSAAFWQSLVASLLLLAALAGLFGAVYAGSPATIAEGVRVAGVDVGGLTPADARAALERRSARLERVPVVFVADEDRWSITPHRLGVEADWAAAVDAARRQGEGFGPFRGLRRAKVRVFGADIAPPAKVYAPALDYQLEQLAVEIDRPNREAAIVLRGLEPILVRGQSGRKLDQDRAAATMVGALASLTRVPTPLPVTVDPPRVSAADLRPALAQARVALSAPIRLERGKTWWRLRPARIAPLLALPRDGGSTLGIGGAGADAWFARFSKTVAAPPTDARFVLHGDGSVGIRPHRDGLALDVDATRASLLKAALVRAPARRVADAVVATKAPALTTPEAQRLGITRSLASYSTPYSGTADRIHNLQLAVSMIDGALVAPGEAFSLNERVGERTVERGFRSAPVIIGGEYEEGVGGGVSQVATTVFNAAWEAGVKILERAPHSLYISRYPLGRDATVNYPDLDVKFRNDTGHWIVVFGGAGSDGISITIAGTPTGRRVASEAGPLTVTGPVPIKRVPDPTLPVGERTVEEEGAPPRSVTVTRTVYNADGSVLYDEVWRTNYRGEKRVVRVGTKKAEPKPPPKDEKPVEEAPPPPGAPPDEVVP